VQVRGWAAQPRLGRGFGEVAVEDLDVRAGAAVPTSRSRARRRDVTRAKKVAVLDDIAGTCLDKGDEIDAIALLTSCSRNNRARFASHLDRPS
jgi:hypothetical protein